ncbi:MAG TPA: glycosyltransferase family 1 protein [Candidatus Dormibacteraeota bacterium]|nr:glycosyltransferase family 1 protein [Candidatus Dormibacteraeota bacterium]
MTRLAVDGSGLARPMAGMGTYTRHILAAMASARADAEFVVYGPQAAGDAVPGALRQTPRLPLVGRHLLWPLALRRLRASAFLGCAGQLPLGGAGGPAAITVHDLAIYRHPEWFPEGQWLSVKLAVPRSLRRADAVIAVSRNTADDARELFSVPPERIHVVPLGAGSEFRPPAPEAVEAERRRLGLPERFILFFSTIEPRKNLHTLLDAWERMGRTPALVVAGGWGWRSEELRGRFEAAGDRLRLLGQVAPADLPSLYGLADCLAHPAWYEGFGLTPLEAMACGTPVVCSDSSSLPEVVAGAGLLVSPGDAWAWAEALGSVLEDAGRRRAMREAGLRRAAELTWERAAKETWAVLDGIARR